MMRTVILRMTPLALLLSATVPAYAAASGQAEAPGKLAGTLAAERLAAKGTVQVQTVPATTVEPGLPKLTAAQWREDLRFMAAEMHRRHKNLYHSVSRPQFDAAVADLDARIPELQRNEIVVGMMRIAAMVGDGHSRLDPRKDKMFGFPSLPLKLYLFEDGLYVRAAAPEHSALVGARIISVGGVPIKEAIRRVGEISSRDNEQGLKLFAALYINMPDILHALGMSPRRDAAVLGLSKSGRTWTARVQAGAVEPIWPPDTDVSLVTPKGWVDARKPAQPIWLQAPLDYHRVIELPEQKALYVQLNMGTHMKGQTLAEFGEKVREQSGASNPCALILDLRLNQGGNGSIQHPFVRSLIKAEDEDTRLFVLSWRGTFSASQFILDDLDRLSNAVFIGEPASSKPSSFGDAYRMPMPNSGISVRSSIAWWQEGQNTRSWTPIDVAVPYSFADYAAGRDPVLAAALNYQERPALGATLAAAASTGGKDAVRKAADSYRLDPANRYSDLALHMSQAAQFLHASNYPEEARLVAELAGTHYPNDRDAFLVLGHLAEAQGHRETAREAVKRVLQLDPNDRQARGLAERLSIGAK
jgi:hypothetical protein